MSLQVKQNYVEDIEKFQWENYRAVTIHKEKRAQGDFYFALVARYFKQNDELGDIDVSNNPKDYCYIGRHVTAIGKRVFSKDPEKPGIREYEEPIWEEVEIVDPENTNKKIKEKVLVKGKRVWKYTLPVNEENTKKFKKLVGQIDVNVMTAFKIILGTDNPVVVDETTFFSKSVEDIMQHHYSMLQTIKKKNA